MSKLIIEGGVPFKGRIKVAGNKNAVLPCMAACLLTSKECSLDNVPQINDVLILSRLLQMLGVKIEGLGTSTLKINAKGAKLAPLDDDLCAQLRASVLLLGPLLSHFGKVLMPHPGGDIIGRRAIDTHVQVLNALGAKFEERDGKYFFETKELKGNTVFLAEASVTATENAILAAVLASGKTVIKNAASEPHVTNLCYFLEKMGAKISGIGSNFLTISGVKSLSGTRYRICPDHIEAGTFAIAAATTQGEVTIEDIDANDLDMILVTLSRMGIRFELSNSSLKIFPSKLVSTDKIVTNIWPGFPTDLVAPMIVLATQAEGQTLLHDWMYESRMFFVDKLLSMGANVTIADPHRVLVYGPTPLKGQKLDTPDIRAGIALVIAALCARGKSEIDKAELIERGYEKIEDRLSALGAKITRKE